jgi:hypothetical protein
MWRVTVWGVARLLNPPTKVSRPTRGATTNP